MYYNIPLYFFKALSIVSVLLLLYFYFRCIESPPRMSKIIHHLHRLGNQFHYNCEFMNVRGLHTSLQGLPSSNEEI